MMSTTRRTATLAVRNAHLRVIQAQMELTKARVGLLEATHDSLSVRDKQSFDTDEIGHTKYSVMIELLRQYATTQNEWFRQTAEELIAVEFLLISNSDYPG